MTPPRKTTAGTAARKAEANGATKTFTWRGREWTVSVVADDWSVDFMEAVEEGKTVGIVRGALGPAQWRHVRNMNLKMKDLSPLADKIAEAMGFVDAGE